MTKDMFKTIQCMFKMRKCLKYEAKVEIDIYVYLTRQKYILFKQ